MPFPNLKNKHLHDSMLSPQEFLNYERKIGNFKKANIPASAIFCYSNYLGKFTRKNYPVKKINTPMHGENFILNSKPKKILFISGFGIGAPVTGTILEELIALGVKEFISIGASGGLQKSLKIGSIVVCNKAIRDEGTSHHYLKPSKYAYPSKTLTKKLIQALEQSNIRFEIGSSWTIDAPYRETVAEAKQYQEDGILTVEMEASALFAIAQYRNVHLASAFSISDSLAELEWKPEFHSKPMHQGLETILKAAIQVLSTK